MGYFILKFDERLRPASSKKTTGRPRGCAVLMLGESFLGDLVMVINQDYIPIKSCINGSTQTEDTLCSVPRRTSDKIFVTGTEQARKSPLAEHGI